MLQRTDFSTVGRGLVAAVLASLTVGVAVANAGVPFPAPRTVPTTIQAEDFDSGGPVVAYDDNDVANTPGACRPGEQVDLEFTADLGGGCNVGRIEAGEELDYTVNVPVTRTYDIGIRWASGTAGGTIHLEENGIDVSGPVVLPNTSSTDYQTWRTVWVHGVTLHADPDTELAFHVDSATAEPEIGNLNYLVISVPATSNSTPWPTGFAQRGNAPGPRFESAVTQLNGLVYSFGSFKDMNFTVDRSYVAYDVRTDTWTTLGNLPAGMAETHLGITNDGRYIYFAGGFGGDLKTVTPPTPSQTVSSQVWRFDPQASPGAAWQQMKPLPTGRGAGALVFLDGKLHYFGGNPADRVTNTADHWVYDLGSGLTGGTWTSKAPMPNPKDHFSSLAYGGKIYEFGGEHGHDQLHEQQSDAWVYTPGTDSWKQLAGLPDVKSHIEGGTFVSDGKVIMAGGQVDNYQPTGEVFAYDLAANDWSVLTPSLPLARQGGLVQRVGSQIVIALGASQTNDPRSETWTGQLPAVDPPPGGGGGTGGGTIGGGVTTPITPIVPKSEAPTACTASRTAVVSLKVPRTKRLKTVRVSINGGRYKSFSARSATMRISLAKQPQKVKISIVAKTTSGRTLRASHTYTGCGKPAKRTLTLKA